jgi:L-ascorbate metabolism protein UlaG (beta-lactamase superfamily)
MLASIPGVGLSHLMQRRERWEMFAHDDPMETPTIRPDAGLWDNGRLTVAWIGHSTLLINFFGIRIITDPVLYERIGLNVLNLFTIGPRRLIAPALTFESLPPIDLILVSHAHMDHLDTHTISKFDREIPIVMAKNTVDVIEDFGFQQIYELDWGQWTEAAGVRIEALEVKHFGWRYPWEKDRSRGNPDGRSYNAYLLSRNGRHILFGGDTAYHEKFRSLARRNITIDLAMMPIGAYDPWIYNHCNPEQALSMADHMRAHYMLPMHWRTFVQSQEPTLEPMKRLHQAAAENPGRIVLDTVGQTWTHPGIADGQVGETQSHTSLTPGEHHDTAE